MRYNPKEPRNPANDRFVLSKGHAAPILYAAWAQAGFIPLSELTNLRKIDNPLEGHPTPVIELYINAIIIEIFVLIFIEIRVR